MLGVVPTPEGSEVVSMSCNGNGSYFFLQSSLIAVIWSKRILGLTTSLTLQTKLPYKLRPTDQLAMLNEKCVLEDGSSGVLCTWCFFFIHLTILITLQIKHSSFFLSLLIKKKKGGLFVFFKLDYT